jgi:hypothetical protein
METGIRDKPKYLARIARICLHVPSHKIRDYRRIVWAWAVLFVISPTFGAGITIILLKGRW